MKRGVQQNLFDIWRKKPRNDASIALSGEEMASPSDQGVSALLVNGSNPIPSQPSSEAADGIEKSGQGPFGDQAMSPNPEQDSNAEDVENVKTEWPDVWNEKQAQEFKEKNPWLRWKKGKLGKLYLKKHNTFLQIQFQMLLLL